MILAHSQIGQGDELETVVKHIIDCRDVSDTDDIKQMATTIYPYSVPDASFLESRSV